MGDMMTFPQTVEEFMEQYKVVDTEQIYSNGSAYVPIFRMKQWFDHVKFQSDYVDVVRCKDCKHLGNNDDYYFCNAIGIAFGNKPNWFCADGERRND